MKKYKNIFLFLLIVLSVILNNYKNINNNTKDYNEENKLSYFVKYSKYDLSKKYVYVGDDTDFEVLSNVSIQSTKGKIEEGMLRFYQWDYVLVEFILVRAELVNLKVSSKNIILDSSMSYENFTSNIKTLNATYKILNEDEEITSGDITSGMKLKIYYNDEEIDSYNIIDEYINLNNINIKDNKYIIKNVSKVGNLKQEIDTSGNIIVEDKDGNILGNNDFLTTNSKIKIQLSNNTYEYTIIVLGDITGSGDIFIGDVSKLYQYYKGLLEMDECYIIAGDVTYDEIIEINDIAKLYQYFKGTISSL